MRAPTRVSLRKGGGMETGPGRGMECGPAARVLIADDHALLRAGMRAMLAGEPDIEVVGEAADGREAVQLCRELRPDLILMDVGMPGLDGMQATREIKARHPAVSVLVVTAHPSPDYVLDAVRAGAAGYLLKTATRDEVVTAIRKVLRNEFPLDGRLAAHLIQRLARESAPPGAPSGHTAKRRAELPDALTSREKDVLCLLAAGKTNRTIAQEMHLSLSTVKRRVERIISKLGVSDRTQAAVQAAERGLLDPNRGAGRLRLISGQNEPLDPLDWAT